MDKHHCDDLTAFRYSCSISTNISFVFNFPPKYRRLAYFVLLFYFLAGQNAVKKITLTTFQLGLVAPAVLSEWGNFQFLAKRVEAIYNRKLFTHLAILYPIKSSFMRVFSFVLWICYDTHFGFPKYRNS